MIKKLALIVCVALLAACAQTVHYVNGNSIDGTRKVTDNSDYFISGLAQKKMIDAKAACGNATDVIATETYHSPVNYLLGFLTFGIYTPQEQTVYCRK
jgi:hypothetical protein